MPGRFIFPALIAAGTIVGWIVMDMVLGPRSERDGQQQEVAIEVVLAEGEQLYLDHCLTCHQASGGGVPYLQPPLAGSDLVNGNAAALISFVLTPPNEPGGEYENVMPPFDLLSDQELASVLSYTRASFGNNASAISVQTVTSFRPQE